MKRIHLIAYLEQGQSQVALMVDGEIVIDLSDSLMSRVADVLTGKEIPGHTDTPLVQGCARRIREIILPENIPGFAQELYDVSKIAAGIPYLPTLNMQFRVRQKGAQKTHVH